MGWCVAKLWYLVCCLLMTHLLAENADDMSLQCLQSWCEKWSVEMNVEKSAVMHEKKRD